MSKKMIVDIRSFKIPLTILILKSIDEYGFMDYDELINDIYPKEIEYQIISETLEIKTKIDFDNLGIREELDILNQLSLIKKSSGSFEITKKGKDYLEIYDRKPREVIDKFYIDLRNTNDLFRILCEKLEESHDGYVEKIVLESSHPKANKPRISYFIGLVTNQFKIAQKEKNGLRLIKKIERPSIDVIGRRIISIYKRDIDSGLFLTINYIWREIKNEFPFIQEEDFDNAISDLVGKFPGKINGLAGIAKEGDKVFVDKMTNSVYQYLEIYSSVFEEEFK